MTIKPTIGPLGQHSEYPSTYTPSVLHSMDRSIARARLGLLGLEQLRGEDNWNGYEFSWLDTQGKPHVAGLRVRVPCQSPAIVESKSLKLYLNSFSQTKFESLAAVQHTLDQDLTLAFRSPLTVEVLELSQLTGAASQLPGECLDELDVWTNKYKRDADFLKYDEGGSSDLVVTQAVHTHLFRSLCPVTGQPDWASVGIAYRGRPIAKEGLLRYLISYRNHQAFHETTIEQIYADILERCVPERLSVHGCFVRRGGLDINPFRASDEDCAPVTRLPRQ